MTKKNPIQQILKAYYNVLNGTIIYNGSIITVGTKIPRGTNNYIHLSASSDNYSTGDQTLYKITVTLQIVSRQGINEGDETIINSILDQVLSVVDDPEMILMDDFRCLMSNVLDIEKTSIDADEANTIITKSLNMLNFIEQK